MIVLERKWLASMSFLRHEGKKLSVIREPCFWYNGHFIIWQDQLPLFLQDELSKLYKRNFIRAKLHSTMYIEPIDIFMYFKGDTRFPYKISLLFFFILMQIGRASCRDRM